jgi:hypothetical protein
LAAPRRSYQYSDESPQQGHDLSPLGEKPGALSFWLLASFYWPTNYIRLEGRTVYGLLLMLGIVKDSC